MMSKTTTATPVKTEAKTTANDEDDNGVDDKMN